MKRLSFDFKDNICPGDIFPFTPFMVPRPASNILPTRTVKTEQQLMTDQEILMSRVKELLQGRIHGLFLSQIEKMNAKQWGDSLAGQWWEGIESWAAVVSRQGGRGSDGVQASG